jgi:hypothetical protein
MNEPSDFHTIPVSDADWEEAARRVKAARASFDPDRPELRPGHSSRGKKEAREVGKIALKRWADERGVKPDRCCKARVCDYGDDLLVPEDEPDDRPQQRHCQLERPRKEPGHTTYWTFKGWIVAVDAPSVGEFRDDLPQPAWVVPGELLHTPDELIEVLSRGR